jgi:hypothetical protein
VRDLNGGDLTIGRKLGSVLGEAGFARIRCQARYECYAPISLMGEYISRQIEGLV